MPSSMAFAYQSILSLGIFPLRRSPTPHPFGFIPKCGSGILGKLILKLNSPLILSITPFTMLKAFFIGFTMIAFTPPHIVFITAFIPLNATLPALFILLHIETSVIFYSIPYSTHKCFNRIQRSFYNSYKSIPCGPCQATYRSKYHSDNI